MRPNIASFSKWLFGAGAGAAFVAITQLATKSTLGVHDSNAILDFAIALPLLSTGAVVNFGNFGWRSFWLYWFIAVAGFGAAYFFIGVATLLLSLSATAGAAFIFVTIFAVLSLMAAAIFSA